MGPAAPSADNQEILGRIPKKGAVPVQAESEKHRANLLLLVRMVMPLRPGRLKKSLGLLVPASAHRDPKGGKRSESMPEGEGMSGRRHFAMLVSCCGCCPWR